MEGMFADPQYAISFSHGLQLSDIEKLNKVPWNLGQAWLKANGIGKLTVEAFKTVLSPITHTINFTGNAALATIQGVLNPATLVKATLRTIQPASLPTEEWVKYVNKRIALGMMDSNVKVGQLQDYWKMVAARTPKDDASKGIFKKSASFVWKNMKRLGKIPATAYQMEDSIWKNMVFDNRLAFIKRNVGNSLDNMPTLNGRSVEEVLEHFTARRTRNRMPNWHMVPQAVKGMRQIPLGTFVGWSAEIMRTVKNNMKGILTDLAGGMYDEIAQAAGFKNAKDMLERGRFDLKSSKGIGSASRTQAVASIGGLSGVALLPEIFTDTSRSTYGISKGEHTALTMVGNPFAWGSIIYQQAPKKVKKKDGLVHRIYTVSNTSRINPINYLRSPALRMYKALFSGEELSQAEQNFLTNKSLEDLYKPFFDPSLFAKGIWEVGSALYKDKALTSIEKQRLKDVLIGPSGTFTPGFLADSQTFERSKQIEDKNRPSSINPELSFNYEWNNKDNAWIRTQVEGTTASGYPKPTKYAPPSFNNLSFDANAIQALLGFQKKEIDVTLITKNTLKALWRNKKKFISGFNQFAKQPILGEAEFFDDPRAGAEERVVDQVAKEYRYTLNKAFKLDEQALTFIRHLKNLRMKNSEILQATNIDSIKSNEPKLLNLRDLQRVLTGRFDASILKPKKLSYILQEIKNIHKLDSNSYKELTNQIKSIYNEYNNKLLLPERE